MPPTSSLNKYRMGSSFGNPLFQVQSSNHDAFYLSFTLKYTSWTYKSFIFMITILLIGDTSSTSRDDQAEESDITPWVIKKIIVR